LRFCGGRDVRPLDSQQMERILFYFIFIFLEKKKEKGKKKKT